MSIETYDRAPWTPRTEEEKAEVRRQLNRLLETSHFRNSKRYPPLFRFIVEEALEGRGEFLKERLLGVRVFDRPADYDTATDPIVRVTIAEIRKRIAQYYHEEAHESEMRIELSPGRYEPEFRVRPEPVREPLFGVQATEEAFSAAVPLVISPAGDTAGPADARLQRSRWMRWTLLGISVSVLLVTAGWFGWRWTHPTAMDLFWRPVLGSRGDVRVVLPRATGSAGINGEAKVVSGALVRSADKDDLRPKKAPTFLEYESLWENVVFSDVRAAMRTSEFVIGHGRQTHPLMSTEATLDDLRQGPTILVGGLDNPWTMRTLAPLRFQFAGSDSQGFWIMDTQHPEAREWWLDLRKKYAVVDRDYAIVARVHDGTTGEPVVIVAGIGTSGTTAAAELLGDPEQQEILEKRIGSGFRDRDFEVVVGTDVVNGMTGSPRILAVAIR